MGYRQSGIIKLMDKQKSKSEAIKLICLNIEGGKHFARILPFLKSEKPDVICLQEVFYSDIGRLESELCMSSCFAPMMKYPSDDKTKTEPEIKCLAIFSKNPLRAIAKDYYVTNGRQAGDVIYFRKYLANTVQKILISGVLDTDDGPVRVANTHFTWTPDGRADDIQRHDIKLLLGSLSKLGQVIVCGDFNAPRGGEIYTQLSGQYTDWVPQDVTTTIDQELHRTKGLELVVDAIFSSQNYSLSDVRIVSGLSDHCAIVGQVKLNKDMTFSPNLSKSPAFQQATRLVSRE